MVPIRYMKPMVRKLWMEPSLIGLGRGVPFDALAHDPGSVSELQGGYL